MDTVIDVHAAKTHLSQLLDRVHAGEEIVIAKGGKPYARLVPLAPVTTRLLDFVSSTIDEAFFDPLPDDELAAWG